MFQGQIKGVELLGNEQIITVSGLSADIVSRIPTKDEYKVGDIIQLYIDRMSVFFFDKESEKRVS